jgi:hypothetical protein
MSDSLQDLTNGLHGRSHYLTASELRFSEAQWACPGLYFLVLTMAYVTVKTIRALESDGEVLRRSTKPEGNVAPKLAGTKAKASQACRITLVCQTFCHD